MDTILIPLTWKRMVQELSDAFNYLGKVTCWLNYTPLPSGG